MTYALIEDGLFAHPKVRRAWARERGALGLYLLGLSYTRRYCLDGRLPVEFAEDQLPDAAERERVVGALLDTGLWDRNGDGFAIHDFRQWNKTEAQLRAARKADRDRQRQYRKGKRSGKK